MKTLTPEQQQIMEKLAPIIGEFRVVFFFTLIFVMIIRAGIFKKAGKSPWLSLIPIYGDYVYYGFVMDMPWLGLITWIVPFLVGKNNIISVNSIIGIILLLLVFIIRIFGEYYLAKRFGEGVGFALGLIFIPYIFYPLLAFGTSKYHPIEKKTENNKLEPDAENS